MILLLVVVGRLLTWCFCWWSRLRDDSYLSGRCFYFVWMDGGETAKDCSEEQPIGRLVISLVVVFKQNLRILFNG